MDSAPVSEPHVGVVDPAGFGDYWVAWRMHGGIWANHLIPGGGNDTAFEALPAYTGWFDVEADRLLYEGGEITLVDPPVPPRAPEPTVFVRLLSGILCVGGHRLIARFRSSP